MPLLNPDCDCSDKPSARCTRPVSVTLKKVKRNSRVDPSRLTVQVRPLGKMAAADTGARRAGPLGFSAMDLEFATSAALGSGAISTFWMRAMLRYDCVQFVSASLWIGSRCSKLSAQILLKGASRQRSSRSAPIRILKLRTTHTRSFRHQILCSPLDVRVDHASQQCITDVDASTLQITHTLYSFWCLLPSSYRHARFLRTWARCRANNNMRRFGSTVRIRLTLGRTSPLLLYR